MNPLESTPNPDAAIPADNTAAVSEETSFGDVLRQFEAEHHSAEGAESALEGTVVSVSEDAIVVDIGRKMEGILKPDNPGLPAGIIPGMTLLVNIKGADDGYYLLSTIRVEQPRDFTGLQAAFEAKSVISGVVLEMVKGGMRVQVADGVHAFLPASRSGIREMSDMPKIVGQQIECRITKLDVTNPERPDVVVDRRGVIEEQSAVLKMAAMEGLSEGMVVQGRVRSLTEFGAFVEIASGIDGLLHVTDMSWQRVDKPASLLAVGQSIETKILKINRESKKISLGLKQLQPDPWTQAISTLEKGQRVTGKVVRLADFGAFIEIAPGVDGLIHLSEMSWTKRIRKPSDILKVDELVEAVVLEIKPADKRISLGLKQALGNPWDSVDTKFAPGTQVEAPITNLAQFGAFVDLGDGIEGMIHVGDITREKRIQHPKEMLNAGQVVKAVVLEVDKEKRRIRLGMKQLEPTSADIFIGEHTVGELLSGRVVEVHGGHAKIEIAEGVHARCKTKEEAAAAATAGAPAADVDDLAAMLASRWKSGPSTASGAPKDSLRVGQIRRFKITAMDLGNRRIEIEFAD
ncbi:MAG TPA: S1 RNA-binding domain-containing protein [Paludibaculum sp.]|jgi:small subunit ribosomal protein S1